MRDSPLLEDALSPAARALVTRVLECETSNFGKLVKLGKLNPARDLRHADLRDVDFTDTDLRGYDFTGSDLRGSHGIRVNWDPASTILVSADLDGSIFAHKANIQSALANDETRLLHHRVRGLSWADQIIWATRHLRPGAQDLERSKLIAASVFERTSDSFLKGEILKYLVRSSQGPDQLYLYDFILDIINGYSGDLHLISKAIDVLSKSMMRSNNRLQSAVEPLLSSQDDKVVALAVQFLTKSYSSQANIKQVGDFALGHHNRAVGNAFVGTLAFRLGPAYDLVARDPTNNDYRPLESGSMRKNFP